MATTKDTLQRNLNEFLRQYRKAPHTTMGQPPSQLFFGRSLCTRLDLVRYNDKKSTETVKPQNQGTVSFRTFKPSQTVYFLSGNPRMDRWIPGVIVTRLGDLHYKIEYNGRQFKRHVDQIRNRQVNGKAVQTARPVPQARVTPERRIRYYKETGPIPPVPPAPPSPAVPPTSAPMQRAIPVPKPARVPRRSQRPRRPPQRLNDYTT